MKNIPVYLVSIALFLSACSKKAENTAETAVSADSLQTPLQPKQLLGIAIIEPAGRLVALASEQSGVVKNIDAVIGQSLKAGALILELDATVENAQLEQAKAKIATQNNAVAAAQENAGLLEVKIQKARADLSRDEALFKGNAATQQQLDNTRAVLTDLEQQLKAQDATVRQQQTRLAELQADIRYFQTLVGHRVVRAPADGILLSIDIRKGEYLDARTTFGDFAPEGPVIAVTEIDELFADKVRIGQTAIIRLQGRNEALTTGKVVLTSPYLRKKSLFSEKAGDLEDRRVREVRVQIDEPSKVLLGARVECLIQL